MPFACVVGATIAKSFVEREIRHVLDETLHGLVVPCGSIVDLADQLASGKLQEPRRTVALMDLKSETERILRYAEQALEFQRYEAKPIQLCTFCLRALIQNRVDKFRVWADKKGVRVGIES